VTRSNAAPKPGPCRPADHLRTCLVVAWLGFFGIGPNAGPDLRAAGPAGTAGPLWVSETPLEDGRRLLVVVDATTRHAAVYHVDATTGSLTLRSTRDLSWDLRLDDFNAQEPKPAALRRLLETPVRP
jgi:hypothetical protein